MSVGKITILASSGLCFSLNYSDMKVKSKGVYRKMRMGIEIKMAVVRNTIMVFLCAGCILLERD